MRAFVDDYAGRMAGVSFRALGDADLPFLSELYAETRGAELARIPWPEGAKRSFLAEQFRLQHDHYQQNYRGADFLVVCRDGTPVGRVYVYRSPSEIRLMDIMVVASERRKGIGTSLIVELMAEARESGSTITLHVERENPARPIYGRLGFRLLEDRGVYLFLGWSP